MYNEDGFTIYCPGLLDFILTATVSLKETFRTVKLPLRLVFEVESLLKVRIEVLILIRLVEDINS